MPRSILSRYQSLDAVARGEVAPPAPSSPAADEVPPLTPAHLEVVRLLDELLTLGETHAPPAVSTLTRALRRLEPQLLESFGRVDPDVVLEFLHRLGERFLSVGSADARQSREHLASG